MLPGIIPRIRDLMSGGFCYISFYMAQLFRAVRLLPAGHPYLSPANFGRFGISHVTAETWRAIVHGQRQLDQVLIFGLVMLGLGILFVQFCFLGLMLFVQAAHAALPAGGFLNTLNPTDDLAFILLDSIFGIPADGGGQNFFGSCVAQAIECFSANPYPHPPTDYPLPYHFGFHAMLQVYSVGLLTIAMLIFCYFAVTILIETAEHGTPFGKRFNHVWAPIRMVMALALLIPIASGLNAAQYIVLYAAKWGSGFATNGWTLFVGEATAVAGSTILGDPKSLVAIPNTPPVNTLMEFATILAACKFAEASDVNPREIGAYVIFPDAVGPASRADLAGLSYADALQRSNYGDIHYVFGIYEEVGGNPVHTSYPGQVRPVCGELVLNVSDVDDVNSPGSQHILESYHLMIGGGIWDDILNGNDIAPGASLRTYGYGVVRRNMKDVRMVVSDFPAPQNPTYPIPGAEELGIVREAFAGMVSLFITQGIALQIASPQWTSMLDYGWAGAGIWYNNIARLNGTFMTAAYTLPTPIKYPEVMEYVAKQRQMHKESGTGPERFNPELSNGKKITFDPPKGEVIAQTLYKAQDLWTGAYTNVPQGGANPFVDTMNALFGTEGLFELSKNTDIHPLAALVAMGKSLVESSIRNLGAATTAGVAGGFANFFKDLQPLGKPLISASSFALQVAMIALAMGFMLFYVLPFIPFLYFFFAVGGWVKGIFESIVAVPLWALAHLRIDGEGMPGDAARGGYFMIFEIFLRPILIVFGMLAAVTIYAAQVKILNEIWPLVTSNVTGFNATTAKGLPADELGGLNYARGVVDRFFYTVMYAIVVYMMGMSSFKLIDMIPNQILRWLGTDASGFSDQSQSGPEGLMTKMSVGTNMMTSQVGAAGQRLLQMADTK